MCNTLPWIGSSVGLYTMMYGHLISTTTFLASFIPRSYFMYLTKYMLTSILSIKIILKIKFLTIYFNPTSFQCMKLVRILQAMLRFRYDGETEICKSQ